MPIKIKNMNMEIIKGDVPLKSVMIGSKCVYGFDFTAFKISYPAVSNGAGLYIDVNGSRELVEPETAGELVVHYGDRIIIRTYADIGYENPASTVVLCGKPVSGTDYAVNTDGLNIIRSTTYEYIVQGDSAITLDEAVPAPRVNISVNKDAGIGEVTVYYMKGAYESSGLNDSPLETTENPLVTADNAIQMYLYSKISPRNPSSIAEEGYKVISTTKNFSGPLTEDNQCTVTAVSQAGTRVSIVCPPIQDGVAEYALYMVSSEYSRNVNDNTKFYWQTASLPSQTSEALSQRHDNIYYFYKGDTIRITAKRKDGYKYPTLGTSGNTTAKATSTRVVLSDKNVLVVESGEQGVPVSLVNESFWTGEYVYLNVTSEYTDRSSKIRMPKIYVGDIITVPLSPDYRIGTRTRRKPGVGFSADGNVILAPTLTAAATVEVPNASVLTVNLQHGAARKKTSQYSLGPVATFSRKTNVSPMEISYRPITTLTPESGYGPEEFFLDTFDLKFSCKRYWLDAITDKYIKITIPNVQSNFSYTYDCDIWPSKVVLAGSYTIKPDGKGVTVTVSKYDTDWVANTSDEANLIPREITI